MPWRAMSIMPLERAAPTKMPVAATIMITRNDAAFEPIDAFRKLTASLLTPTERSNMARTPRNTTKNK